MTVECIQIVCEAAPTTSLFVPLTPIGHLAQRSFVLRLLVSNVLNLIVTSKLAGNAPWLLNCVGESTRKFGFGCVSCDASVPCP